MRNGVRHRSEFMHAVMNVRIECFMIAILAMAGIALPSRADPANRATRSESSEVRSIRGLSHYVLGSGPRRSRGNADVRLLRQRLAALRAALDEVEADPAPVRVDRMRNRKAAAVATYQAIRARASSSSRREGSSQGASGARERAPIPSVGSQSIDVAAEMKSLWQDVDYALADPIGQRARLQLARQRIDAALEQPADLRGPSMTWRLDLATADRR